jgi:phosphoglycolate phosphatase
MFHLIWDLDGTLIDSSREIIACLELAIKNSDLELSKQIRPFIIGPTIDTILREAFPFEYLTDHILQQVISNFRAIYDNSGFEMTKPFPGIEAIVRNNQSFMHHIVTNKPDMPTRQILKKFGWTMYITTVSTPYTGVVDSDKKHLRSKSELFSDLIRNYGSHSLFIGIGDMKSDCIAAKDNNIRSIGVLWGAGTREELSNCCDYLFDNTKQLCDFLHTNLFSEIHNLSMS